jgi:hypothetical protein
MDKFAPFDTACQLNALDRRLDAHFQEQTICFLSMDKCDRCDTARLISAQFRL